MLYCRPLPSDSYYSYSYLTFAICDTDCNVHDSSFSSCYTQSSVDGRCYSNCDGYISVTCFTYTRDYDLNDDDGYDDDYDDSSDSGFSSGGAVVGTTIGGLSICGIIVLVVICRIYVRHSLIRRRSNQTYIITQRRPRILVARVTRTTTVPSGPPPPPPYTPKQPTSALIPSGDNQLVSTDDYTTAPTAPSRDDIPSEPPPEYTPSVSTDTMPLITQDTVH